MREAELKYRVGCGELGRIGEALEGLGFKLVESTREEDYYYNHPCRDYATTDEALRVRVKSGGGVIVTYKGPRIPSRAKYREEVEVLVGDDGMDRVKLLLSRLGFRVAAVVVKERAYYSNGRLTVSLDRVEGLGCFVEIESEGPTDDLAGVARSLGLRESQRVDKTYLELVMESSS